MSVCTNMNTLIPDTATCSGFTPSLLRRSATAPSRAKPAIIAAAIIRSPLATSIRSKPATSRNQGPAHKVWTARKVAWDITAQGAMRQKTKLEYTLPTPRSCSLRLAPAPSALRSGTTTNMAAATANVSTASTVNRPRQSVICRAASTGAVPASAPMPPTAT